MEKSYSWLELANMPVCCMCCGSKNVNVTFNIETIDSTGFDELLTERKSTITNIIRDAAFERGERSPV